MTTTITPLIDADWTDVINNASINNGASATSSTIPGQTGVWTEVSVEVTYGTPANEGLKVYVLRETDDDVFQTANDAGTFQRMLTWAAGAARSYAFRVREVGKFKVHLVNDSGAQVTGVFVRYFQQTGWTAV